MALTILCFAALSASGCNSTRARSMAMLAQTVRDAGIEVTDVSRGKAFLPERAVTLEVTDVELEKGRAHLHVLATTANSALDFCVNGLGQAPTDALQQTAEVFTASALPPLLRQLGAPAPRAIPFSGKSAWGVSGVRGWVGEMVERGSAATEIRTMFEGIPSLPLDGRLHLLKSVVVCQERCARTLEFDGTQIEKDRALDWRPSEQFGMYTQFAVVERADALADVEAERVALKRLSTEPTWDVGRLPECVADRLPQRFFDSAFDEESCLGGRLRDCLRECESGQAPSCYAAALTAQRDTRFPPKLDDLLFLRACSLGYASGCTNGAAGRLKNHPDDACATRVFERTCDEASDGWACTMFGRELLKRPTKDAKRISEVLTRACTRDDSDPACLTATRLLGDFRDGSRTGP